MHQGERGDELGILKVGIVLRQRRGEEHALVGDDAGRARGHVIFGEVDILHGQHPIRQELAHDIELALEGVLVGDVAAAGDEDMAMDRFGRLDRVAENAVVDRNVAPADDFQSFFKSGAFKRFLNLFALGIVMRHEQVTDTVMPGLGQVEAEFRGFAGEEGVRDLHQHAAAVTRLGVGPDRAAVFQIAQYGQAVIDDLSALLVVDVDDETDAAIVVLARGIVETLAFGKAGPRDLGRHKLRQAVFRLALHGGWRHSVRHTALTLSLPRGARCLVLRPGGVVAFDPSRRGVLQVRLYGGAACPTGVCIARRGHRRVSTSIGPG